MLPICIVRPNLDFEKALRTLVYLALDEDLGERGDVTSQATLPEDEHVRGEIIAKEAGVVAGLPAVKAVYEALDPDVVVTFLLPDGSHVEPGTVICEIMGRSRSILTGERMALNFLQHLSGVATLTARYVEAVSGTGAVILDTRKTTPGWRLLEKYAVRMGGGYNHRMGLYDEVLIKNNHVDAGDGVATAIQLVLEHPQARGLPIVVEVRDLVELREALALGVDRILLDNMDEVMMREAVVLAAGRVPLEASGNMTLERVRVVAETGVDFISVGALTHSAPALDLSMRLSPVEG
jgi:nicotinate-nucleotide pyrophosphorylase (carboxylating)